MSAFLQEKLTDFPVSTGVYTLVNRRKTLTRGSISLDEMAD